MSFLFSFLVLFTSPSVAHDGHDHLVKKTPTTQAELENQIMADVHDEMDGHDHAQFDMKKLMSRWALSLNLVRFTVESYRAFESNSKRSDSDHVKNLKILIPLLMTAHLFEMSSGPIGLLAAYEAGLSPLIKSVIGVVGVIISIPGLDPVCLIIVKASQYRPAQIIMTTLRLPIDWASDKIYRYGLKDIFERYIQKNDRLKTMIENDGAKISLKSVINAEGPYVEQMTFTDSANDPYLTFDFHSDKNGTYVHTIRILNENSLTENRDAVLRSLSHLNFGLRTGLNEILFMKHRPNAYVKRVPIDQNSTLIEVKKYSLLLRPKYQFQFETFACSSLFSR